MTLEKIKSIISDNLLSNNKLKKSTHKLSVTNIFKSKKEYSIDVLVTTALDNILPQTLKIKIESVLFSIPQEKLIINNGNLEIYYTVCIQSKLIEMLLEPLDPVKEKDIQPFPPKHITFNKQGVLQKNITDLVKQFELSLVKPHNYVRIAKQYLEYCESENLLVNTASKEKFLYTRTPVYKTAVNKFFKNVAKNQIIKPFKEYKEKVYIVEKEFLNGLAHTSKETYDNHIKRYVAEMGNNFSNEKLNQYLSKFKNIDTYNNTLSVLKTYFQFKGIWVKAKSKKRVRKFTNKGILTEQETDRLYQYTKHNYNLEKTCIIGLMAYLGMRTHDAINFHRVGDSYYSIPKGRKEKVEYAIPKKIETEISEFFKNNTNFNITCTSTIRKLFSKIKKEVLPSSLDEKGNPYSAHSFRHSRVMNRLSKGDRLEDIAKEGGWKSGEMAFYYGQIDLSN